MKLTQTQAEAIRVATATLWNSQLRKLARNRGNDIRCQQLLNAHIEAEADQIFGSIPIWLGGWLAKKLLVAAAKKLAWSLFLVWVEKQLFGGVDASSSFREGER